MVVSDSGFVAFPHLSPTTAIGWLKAIGLLRLSGANGYWKNDCFHLEIGSIDDFVQDFLNHYQPKPFASPWNSSSLFNQHSELLDGVLNSQSDRYALMREGYNEIQEAIKNIDRTGQKSSQQKLSLMPVLTTKIHNHHVMEWLTAVGLIVRVKKSQGKKSKKENGEQYFCNELIGNGGNIGKTEFCTAYYQVCTELWDLTTGEPDTRTLDYIRASVLGESLPQTLNESALLGHTFPAADYFNDLSPDDRVADDYMKNRGNSTQLSNPVDLIFYLEGAATFTGKSIPRNEIKNEGDQEYTIAAYPLLLEVNSGSADTSDRTGRAYEVWLPLWDDPLDWEDFQDLVTNDLSFRLRNQVVDTVDMLSLLRQVDAYHGLPRFSRFGLWKRKGTQLYLIHIGIAQPGKSDFGAELRDWRFRARPTDKQPDSQYSLLIAIHKSLYRLQQGNDDVTTCLKLLGKLEHLHSLIQPIIPPTPQLKKDWVEAVYNEFPIHEVELAVSLASTAPTHKDSKHSLSLRRLWSSARYSPKTSSWFWSDKHHQKLKTSSLEAFSLSLLTLWNEIWQSGIEGKDQHRYHPAHGWNYWASPEAIAAFILGQTDDQLILELTLGFALCEIPTNLPVPVSDDDDGRSPLPEVFQYAASLQWSKNTTLTMQSVNALYRRDVTPLCRQLAAIQHPVILPQTIDAVTAQRSALALVFPCKPFHPLENFRND